MKPLYSIRYHQERAARTRVLALSIKENYLSETWYEPLIVNLSDIIGRIVLDPHQNRFFTWKYNVIFGLVMQEFSNEIANIAPS